MGCGVVGVKWGGWVGLGQVGGAVALKFQTVSQKK